MERPVAAERTAISKCAGIMGVVAGAEERKNSNIRTILVFVIYFWIFSASSNKLISISNEILERLTSIIFR